MAKDLPSLINDSLEQQLKSDEATKVASDNLASQMKQFSASNQTFTKASLTINKFAKAQIDKINPFKKLGAAFDKSFIGQKKIQIKEETKLAEAAGITRGELLLQKAQKELADTQKQQADQLKKSLESYGVQTAEFVDAAEKATVSDMADTSSGVSADAEYIVEHTASKARINLKSANEEALEKDREAQTALVSSIDSGLKSVRTDVVNGVVSSAAMGVAAQDAQFKKSETASIEGDREFARKAAEQTALLEAMVGGLKGLGKSLTDGLKGLGEKGGMGVGMLFGIIAAPVIALVAFFKELKFQFKFLNSLTGGRLGKIFAPVKKLFSVIKSMGTSIGKIFSGKGIPIDKLLKPFKAIGAFFQSIGSKVGALFGKSGTFGKVFGIISKGFAPIAKFAAGFGSVLGKLFLPITIIMGIVDTVTGFMDGFETGGLLGGVMGAIKGLFNGLIMKPLDLLKDAVSWIAGKLGFENFSAMLDGFSFEEVFSGLVDSLESILRSVGDWFNDKVDWVKGLFGMETSKEKEMREGIEKEEAAKQPAKPMKVGVMTKEGMQNLSEEEIREGKKEGTIKRSLADDALRRAKMQKEREGIEGKGSLAGGETGAEVNAKSAASGGGGLNVITTNAPTVVNAPTSTSMNSQTIVPAGAARGRRANRYAQQRAQF